MTKPKIDKEILELNKEINKEYKAHCEIFGSRPDYCKKCILNHTIKGEVDCACESLFTLLYIQDKKILGLK